MGETKKILITAKTYPTPSKTYRETVCTGGVLEDGSFIRLYPIEYRYRSHWEQYSKYDWIEVDVDKNPSDKRPESFKLVKGSKITLLNHISTKDKWAERKKYVLAKATQTMCALKAGSQFDCSIGIIKPRIIKGVKVERVESDWKETIKSKFRQLTLPGLTPKTKSLEKIPYKFSYEFICEESKCKGHRMMDEDWEVGQLYRRMRDKFADEKIAVDKVKAKLIDHLCSVDKDVYFFVGTVYLHNTWVIVGTFCPPKDPKDAQGELNLE